MAPGAERCGGGIGLLFMALSAVCFSLMSLLVHALGRGTDGVSSFELVGIRAVFGLTVSGLWLFRARTNPLGPPDKRCVLCVRGLVGCVAMFINWFLLTQLPLGDATVIVFTAPLFTTLLAWLFLKEALGAVEIAGAALSCVGVVLVARPSFLFGEPDTTLTSFDNSSGMTRGPLVCLGLVGAVASAVTNTIVRKLTSVHSMVTVSYLMAGGLVVSVVWVSVTSTVSLPRTPTGWIYILCICAFGFGGQLFKTQGLKWERAGPGSMMRNLDLVLAFSFQVSFLGEPACLTSIIGAACTLIGSVMLGVWKLYLGRRKLASRLPVEVVLSTQESTDSDKLSIEPGKSACS